MSEKFELKYDSAAPWLYTGEVYFNEEVDHKSAKQLIEQMNVIYKHDEQHKIKRPLRVIVDTNGGYCTQGFMIYDAIRSISKNKKVICHGSGIIASMGVIIYLAADERTASKNVYFMLHEVSDCAKGRLDQMEIDIDLTRKISKRLWNIIVQRTKIKKEETKNFKKDTYLNAYQAKKLGIVQKVI